MCWDARKEAFPLGERWLYFSVRDDQCKIPLLCTIKIANGTLMRCDAVKSFSTSENIVQFLSVTEKYCMTLLSVTYFSPTLANSRQNFPTSNTKLDNSDYMNCDTKLFFFAREKMVE